MPKGKRVAHRREKDYKKIKKDATRIGYSPAYLKNAQLRDIVNMGVLPVRVAAKLLKIWQSPPSDEPIPPGLLTWLDTGPDLMEPRQFHAVDAPAATRRVPW